MKEVKPTSYSPDSLCALDCFYFHDGFCAMDNSKLFCNEKVYYRSINCGLFELLMQSPAKTGVYTCFGQAYYHIIEGDDPLPLTMMSINQNDEVESEEKIFSI